MKLLYLSLLGILCLSFVSADMNITIQGDAVNQFATLHLLTNNLSIDGLDGYDLTAGASAPFNSSTNFQSITGSQSAQKLSFDSRNNSNIFRTYNLTYQTPSMNGTINFTWTYNDPIYNATIQDFGNDSTYTNNLSGRLSMSTFQNYTTVVASRTITYFKVYVNQEYRSPLVIIQAPLNITYTGVFLQYVVNLDEPGYVNYTLDNGLFNLSMTPNATLTGFTASNSSIANGAYTFKVYAWDLLYNANLTAQITFSVNVTSSPATSTATRIINKFGYDSNKKPKLTTTGGFGYRT